jgi:hypothetical protein
MAKDDEPNPYFLGFSIGVGIALTVLVAFRWFPWVFDAKYRQLPDFLFFSVFLFIILIRRYWHVSRLPRFWLVLLILAVVHSVSCWLYITRVGGLSPMRFILITVVELFPAVFFINWFARVRISDEDRAESID